jgi:hypothetical protein
MTALSIFDPRPARYRWPIAAASSWQTPQRFRASARIHATAVLRPCGTSRDHLLNAPKGNPAGAYLTGLDRSAARQSAGSLAAEHFHNSRREAPVPRKKTAPDTETSGAEFKSGCKEVDLAPKQLLPAVPELVSCAVESSVRPIAGSWVGAALKHHRKLRAPPTEPHTHFILYLSHQEVHGAPGERGSRRSMPGL